MTKTAARPIGTTERPRRVDFRDKTRWGTVSFRKRRADFLVEQQGLLLFLHPLTRRAQKWTIAFIGYEPLDGRFCIGNCYRLFNHVVEAIENGGWIVSAITAEN